MAALEERLLILPFCSFIDTECQCSLTEFQSEPAVIMTSTSDVRFLNRMRRGEVCRGLPKIMSELLTLRVYHRGLERA